VEINQFTDVKAVISEPLKFKAKLAIGEDAYGTLKVKNKLAEYWDLYGWMGTGAAAAKTTVVATTFFAPSGVLGFIGLGTAVTPVGWVIAAAILSGGAAIGVRRFLSDATGTKVTVIPKFINTPIDVLALNLFDLIAPLALKVAAVDGQITDGERRWIKDYFANDWGYDPLFLDAGFTLIESKLEDFSIKEIAEKLAEFSKANQDCNYSVMTSDLIGFLKGVMEADGIIDEREEFAIEKIEGIFSEAGRLFSKANIAKAGDTAKESAMKVKDAIGTGAAALGGSLKRSSEAVAKSHAADVAKEFASKSTDEIAKAGKAFFGKIFVPSKNK
jgi:uncharacterized tellurite resistance protein B-like protein